MREISMNELAADDTASLTSGRVLPLLLIMFIGSGCSALIYEVVWFQLLELVIGVSTVSLGILLGTFMGGMCLGSLLFPRLISRKLHPLKVYALMELGIGVVGLALLFGMPLINNVYTSVVGEGMAGMMLRGVIAFICLLPPTLLMGATLPAISRWVETSPRGVSWLGFFYGGNIGGAVIGSLLAGFYLMRVYDITTTTFVAFALNIAVALLSFLLSKSTSYTASEGESEVAISSNAWPIYVSIALSGMTALACEVIWTRLLSLLFGATVYTFSLIVAVFLIGLGIGSTVGSALSHQMKRPRVALAWCQVLLCGAVAWAAYMLTESLPWWPVDPSIASTPLFNFQLDLVRSLWVVLPAAILWGASFPLALAAVASRGQDPARLVGGVYAANTVGAIVGSLGASLILVAWIGSQHSEQVLIAISAISALFASGATAFGAESGRKLSKYSLAVSILILAGYTELLAATVHPLPARLVEYGRFAAVRGATNKLIYMGEGLTASVAVSDLPDGIRNYHNAGKVQASSDPADMRLQRMLGHLTTLIPENPHRVLVIGCGAGVTAGAVSIEPHLQKETIAEIEPLVPKVVSTHFAEHNFDVIRNPKVEVRIDDGRHYLLTSKEKFDGITSDPLDPWVKGAAALYTREFFEIAKQHLNPGGVVTQFVQLYESNEAAVKSEIATFLEAFPNGMVFANTVNGQGYDVVLLGQVEPTKIDVDKLQKKLDSPEYAAMAQSLKEIGINSATDLMATYAGNVADLKPWTEDAMINRDRNMRLQYLAGMSLNTYTADPIYVNMTAHSHYPENLFIGSDATIDTLRRAIHFPSAQ
ncbi:MAG TPA: fused MFS/spermidine synthase [Terriglobia bacterium]|jgi:spermidine synthase